MINNYLVPKFQTLLLKNAVNISFIFPGEIIATHKTIYKMMHFASDNFLIRNVQVNDTRVNII